VNVIEAMIEKTHRLCNYSRRAAHRRLA